MKGWFVAAVGIVIAAALYLMAQANSSGGASGGSPSSVSPLVAFAQAIAKAEGSPASANNPGDLALGDQGNGVLNSAGVTIFSTIEDGWNALYNELQLISNGASKYYNSGMTLAQFAETWTGGDNPTGWAQTVAAQLGVTPGTTIGQILGGQS